jgi:hypothetical protein
MGTAVQPVGDAPVCHPGTPPSPGWRVGPRGVVGGLATGILERGFTWPSAELRLAPPPSPESRSADPADSISDARLSKETLGSGA